MFILAGAIFFAQSPPAVPKSASPQAVCAVAHSLAELKRAFAEGRMPSAIALTGSWVAIGDFTQHGGPGDEESDKVDCAGLKVEITASGKRVKTRTLESALLINGYAIEPRIVANEWNIDSRQRFKPDGRSLTYGLGFGGDAGAYYRCRLTRRGTLACLVEPYYSGTEFVKMSVRPDELCQVKALANGWRLCVAPEEERASGR